MCGRFTYLYTWAEIRDYCNLMNSEQLPLEASWNVAPTQQAPVIVASERGATLTTMRWGLIPSWAKDASMSAKMINARAETVAEKPAFRAAYKARRCIVPASGFYEWKQAGPGAAKAGPKQPFYITTASGEPMTFAGLWERWKAKDASAETFSFTIITTDANDAMAPLHDRMPVILSREGAQQWLRQANAALLKSCPSDWLQMRPVSTAVNSPRNNDASLIAPQSNPPCSKLAS